MQKILLALFAFICVTIFSFPALAHFGMLIPSRPEVLNQQQSELTLEIAFSHPASGHGMDMEKPEAVSVNVNGASVSEIDSISQTQFMGKKAWQLKYRINRPGVYQFAVTPAPYFEEAEDSFIIHYAKVVVPAYGAEDGWQKPLGLPMEIVPLTRPFGNYASSVFQGQILKNGKPLPWATVEIESLNRNQQHAIPNEYYETQVVRADGQGIFTAGIPWGGWWGFAALAEADEGIEFNGQKKNVEIGGVIWVNFSTSEAAQ